jgi:hypothetical protein
MPGSAGCAGARQLTRGVNKRNARKPAQNDGNPRRSPQLLASRIDPENAETEGIPPVFACSLPGSRQHNSASSNNRMSGSPRWIRTTIHGPEKEHSFLLLSAAPMTASLVDLHAPEIRLFAGIANHGLDFLGEASA